MRSCQPKEISANFRRPLSMLPPVDIQNFRPASCSREPRRFRERGRRREFAEWKARREAEQQKQTHRTRAGTSARMLPPLFASTRKDEIYLYKLEVNEFFPSCFCVQLPLHPEVLQQARWDRFLCKFPLSGQILLTHHAKRHLRRQ